MERNEPLMVTITSKEVISAPLLRQDHWLPLSNLDLTFSAFDVGLFLCYGKPPNGRDFTTTVSELKDSLSKTLVTYYPFAGEMVTNSLGEPELLCNNRGVDFVVARVDVRMLDLDFHDPGEIVEGKLVPVKVAGVLSVQVTELNCGGIVIGCSFDHRVSDAHSANMFLVSWSEAASGRPASIVPSFRRSLLYPRRRPGVVYDDTSINNHYVALSSFAPPKPSTTSDQTNITRIYHVSAANIDRMQSLASATAKKSTKIESFCAFLLHTIAKCTATSGMIKNCSMGVSINGRSRLSGSFSNYFGNVISLPHIKMALDEVAEMEVRELAETVRNLIKDTATEEHFFGLIDWVETRRPESIVPTIIGVDDTSLAIAVSSGLQYRMGRLDFGWGGPAFGSYCNTRGGHCGLFMPMLSVAGNGDWILYVHMKRGLLMEIEAKIDDVLRPVTTEHLVVNGQFGTYLHKLSSL